jgi:hypothetical protein
VIEVSKSRRPTLNREKYLVSGTEGIMLVVYHPDATEHPRTRR